MASVLCFCIPFLICIDIFLLICLYSAVFFCSIYSCFLISSFVCRLSLSKALFCLLQDFSTASFMVFTICFLWVHLLQVLKVVLHIFWFFIVTNLALSFLMFITILPLTARWSFPTENEPFLIHSPLFDQIVYNLLYFQ